MTRHSHKIGQEKMKWHNTIVGLNKSDKFVTRKLMRDLWVNPTSREMTSFSYFKRAFTGYKTPAQIKARWVRLKTRGYNPLPKF